ncbi:MAG: hypothetical protein RL481_810, partial [Pseudomonadota bacterium]
RADVAQYHHRCMLLRPAFANVGTRRFFTHGVQFQIAHQFTGFVETSARRRLYPDPIGLALAWHVRERYRLVHERADSDAFLPCQPFRCRIGPKTKMIIDTLTSPVILFFVLGIFAALIKSDLAVPEAFAKAMSIYLMAAIGLKGGIEVAESGLTIELAGAALAGLGLSFLLPFIAYALLTRMGGLNRTDAGAVAAHYGSVSVVTFVTAKEILTGQGFSPAGYMVAVLALMETPAIITGLWLARRGEASSTDGGGLMHEVFANASVVLLVGSFMIGLVAGKDGFEPVKPLFDTGFRGVLCLFLLDMGLIAARRLMQSKKLTIRLVSLAIVLPLVNGTIGVLLGHLVGLDIASAAALGILAASASYIAVPAAMRMALPEADPGIYLSMALGITFPFNIILGITLFTQLSQAIG